MTYHISADGKPRPCKATKSCPIGGSHFPSKLAAIAYLESKELEVNGGSFGRQLDRDQRYRLARSNALPTMRYEKEIGSSVYDRYGNEWVVEAKELPHGALKPTLSLRRVRDGKLVELDPGNEAHTFDTSIEKDPDTGEYSTSTVMTYLTRKDTGNWTIRDFYETIPEPVVLDKPPVRNSEKYSEVPQGLTTLKHAAVRHVNVHTSVDSPVSSRWLIIDKQSSGGITQKQHREIAKAAYEQTGRSLSSFAKLSDFQKSEFVNFEWRPVVISNSGENVTLKHESDAGGLFTLTGEDISPQDIAIYKLDSGFLTAPSRVGKR